MDLSERPLFQKTACSEENIARKETTFKKLRVELVVFNKLVSNFHFYK